MWHVEDFSSTLYIFSNHILPRFHKRDPIHGLLLLTQDVGCWKMSSHNWKGKEDVHFHHTTSCGIFLLIKYYGILGLEEYHAHTNLLWNHDPTKFNK
jgi:hypothetical protein